MRCARLRDAGPRLDRDPANEDAQIALVQLYSVHERWPDLRTLLEGKKARAADNEGLTPLDIARRFGNCQATELLIAAQLMPPRKEHS